VRRCQRGAAQANRIKDDFLATLGPHGLRTTPLNAIVGDSPSAHRTALRRADRLRALREDHIDRN